MQPWQGKIEPQRQATVVTSRWEGQCRDTTLPPQPNFRTREGAQGAHGLQHSSFPRPPATPFTLAHLPVEICKVARSLKLDRRHASPALRSWNYHTVNIRVSHSWKAAHHLRHLGGGYVFPFPPVPRVETTSKAKINPLYSVKNKVNSLLRSEQWTSTVNSQQTTPENRGLSDYVKITVAGRWKIPAVERVKNRSITRAAGQRW